MTSLPGKQATVKVTKNTPSQSNLTQRFVTAFLAGPLVLLLVFLGQWFFFALVLVLTTIGLLEFYNLGRNRGIRANGLLGLLANVALLLTIGSQQLEASLAVFALTGVLTLLAARLILWKQNRRSWLRNTVMTLAGLLYVSLPGGLFILIRSQADGLVWLLLVLFLTWGTDTFAYFGGKWWGKTRLAPIISPKKTREGAIVGAVGGALTGLALLVVTNHASWAIVPLLIIAPLVAILGDLVESALKRVFNVKDSHLSGFDIFPGHGGVLDRTDALILVTLLCYMYYLALQIIR
jgi:phosphatidate cytidylyltransferase